MRRGKAIPRTLLASILEKEPDVNECACRRLAGSKHAKTRLAIYHAGKGRVYRRTTDERKNGVVYCPKCKKHEKLEEMILRPFTRSTKVWICPVCDWKITTDKVV